MPHHIHRADVTGAGGALVVLESLGVIIIVPVQSCKVINCVLVAVINGFFVPVNRVTETFFDAAPFSIVMSKFAHCERTARLSRLGEPVESCLEVHRNAFAALIHESEEIHCVDASCIYRLEVPFPRLFKIFSSAFA